MDFDGLSDTSLSPRCLPEPLSPQRPAEDTQRLYELICKLYLDKNMLAVEMQENLAASERTRTAAEASAASFKVDSLLWKQRATSMEEQFAQLNSRLEVVEAVLVSERRVIADQQVALKQLSTHVIPSPLPNASYQRSVWSAVILIGLLLLMLGLDPRMGLFDQLRTEYSGV